MKVLEVQDVHTYYGKSYILQGLSLAVEAGSVVAVLGRNGVGKTTLIRSICSLTSPRRGKVLFKGRDLVGSPPHVANRLGVGLVPQGRRVFRSLTVLDNLRVAAHVRGAAGWTVDKVLTTFPRLGERLHSRAQHLSGGEQSMLAIGRALVGNPDLLLMDEPTEGLAPLIVQEIGKVIIGLRDAGLSVLLVEQNLGFAIGVADHVYVMSKGQFVHSSTPEELADNTAIKAKYLGV